MRRLFVSWHEAGQLLSRVTPWVAFKMSLRKWIPHHLLSLPLEFNLIKTPLFTCCFERQMKRKSIEWVMRCFLIPGFLCGHRKKVVIDNRTLIFPRVCLAKGIQWLLVSRIMISWPKSKEKTPKTRNSSSLWLIKITLKSQEERATASFCSFISLSKV